MLRRYEELGTLEKVGNEYGVTRERVRQIFNKALKYGITSGWKRESPPPLTEEEAWDLLAAGRYLNVGLARFLDLTPEMCEEFRLLDHQAHTANEYAELAKQCGYPPNNTDLQLKLNKRGLSARIVRYFGGFRAFCERYGHKPKLMPGLSNPQWQKYARDQRGAKTREALEKGLCVLCLRRPQRIGKRTCAPCYHRTVAQAEKMRQRNEYAANR